MLAARAHPGSPVRTWFTALDNGLHTVRVDPLMLADRLAALPGLLPGLTRPETARYGLTVLHWRGMALAERAFSSAALDRWGQTDASWPAVVQAARGAWEDGGVWTAGREEWGPAIRANWG